MCSSTARRTPVAIEWPELLKQKGYKLLAEARKEPWGQTVTRTPWMR